MKSTRRIFSLSLLAAMTSCTAVAIAQQTTITELPDGSTQVVTPQYEQVCDNVRETSAGGAVIGGMAGYAASRLLFGNSSGSLWNVAGSGLGTLVGSQAAAKTVCIPRQVLIGHKIVTYKDGKSVEQFVPFIPQVK